MKIFIIFYLSFSFQNIALAQITNEQNIDQQDLKFLFRQNKIAPYKFSFSSISDSACNLVIEQYLDGKQVQSKNFYSELLPYIKMTDEPRTYYFPRQNGKIKPTLRVYFDENNKDTLRLWINTGTIEKRYSFPLTSGLLSQTRAFDNIPSALLQKQPLVVYYGDLDNMIECPGDAKPLDIIKMYKAVIIVYAEPLKL